MTVFSQSLTAKIESFLTRYETRRSAILPVLHAIQDEHGWVSEEHIETLHGTYGLDRVHVKEVISFYDIYKDKPVKKHLIRFCKSFTCHMLGAQDSMKRIDQHIQALTEVLGDDCPFEMEAFPCLGKCDGAPVMLVGKDRHEHVTVDKVDEYLARYASLPK